MRIDDRWKFKDAVTGITLVVMVGKNLDRLRLLLPKHFAVSNRDFCFTKAGKFDGTGTAFNIEKPRKKRKAT